MSTPSAPPPTTPGKWRRPRPPPLFRTSRWIHRAGVIVVVLLIVFLATVGYSSSKLQVQTPSGNNNHTNATLGFNAVSFAQQINITNGGFYSITGFTTSVLTAVVNGPVVGIFDSNSTTITPGQKYAVLVDETILLGAGDPGQPLLTQNATLTAQGWINATFGYLLGLSIGFNFGSNTSWSAPFSGYAVGVTVSSGVAQTHVFFYNALGQSITGGTLGLTLRNVTGTVCGSGSLPAGAMSNSGFSGTVGIPVAAGCTPAFAQSTITAASYGFTLPNEVLA